jgi:hypothetical protein
MPDLTIPQIRTRLIEIAGENGLPEVAELAEATRRRYHGRRSMIHARKVNEKLAGAVRQYVRQHPEEHYEEVARHFGIKGGRVSEIMHGKRGEPHG